jgi:hypothetical protein
MDGEAIGLRTADTVAQQQGFAVFWTNAKRRIGSFLNSVSNITPAHDLDAYERQQIETLVDGIHSAAQIRGRFRHLK